jgi:hypothetical protein
MIRNATCHNSQIRDTTANVCLSFAGMLRAFVAFLQTPTPLLAKINGGGYFT